MGLTRSLLPQNNGNLTLPFFGDNYPMFLLNSIYQLLYMCIFWFSCILFIHDRIFYTKIRGNKNPLTLSK